MVTMDLMERADYCTMNVGTPYIGHVFAHWSKQGVWRSWFNALFAACMRCARSACTLRRRILVAISFRVSTYVVYPENESNDIDSPNLLLGPLPSQSISCLMHLRHETTSSACHLSKQLHTAVAFPWHHPKYLQMQVCKITPAPSNLLRKPQNSGGGEHMQSM